MSKLIEKEGKAYKECGVVMLQASGVSKIYTTKDKTRMDFSTVEQPQNESFPNQHVYFTSDDEIKDGDWFYDELSTDKIYQRKNSHVYSLPEGAKKIIATTDTSLGLPQPSDKFIQAYIDAYNKGKKIEKVLVEYEENGLNPRCVIDGTSGSASLNWIPKLKDNNIIIKKVKDSWTRDEMETSHLSMAVDIAKHILEGKSFTTFDPEKWIKEHL